MNKTLIEWTDYSWNPVTGCKKDCWYCYVKRIKKYNRDPALHLKRFNQPTEVKKPSKIFVCSTADLFGEWIPEKWIYWVLKVIQKCPQHTFQILTKGGKEKFFKLPQNVWLGYTIEHKEFLHRILTIQDIKTLKFISLEPLFSDMQELGKWIDFAYLDWLIIGAMTGPGSQKYQPKIEWIEDILRQADEYKIPVFLKNNLIPIMGEKFVKKRQQFPKEIK